MKKNKGITLIALVITIVVLLILAGISIKALTGEKGLIKETYNTTDQAQRESIIQKIEADLYQEKTVTGEIPNKLKLKEIIQSKGYNKGELGEDSFVTKDGEYTIDYDEIIGWKDIKEEPKLELTEGDYVKYIDKQDNERICVVLYDESYGYGTQITTMESLENISIGGNDWNTFENSFNNLVKSLNDTAEKYRNPMYATSARCIGTVPNNKDYEASYYTSVNNFEQSGKLKGDDNNYETDYNQMSKLGVESIEMTYWLASRLVSTIAGTDHFRVYYVEYYGSLNSDYVCNIDELKSSYYTKTNGFRPVFTLKSDIKITGGAGTKESPYVLGV